ncbi:MAG: RNA 3'-terminal phosphate cyclase [Candidatus Brockarchaeota archaeon]|nr:RNA 3'-terminal phosphate cyclase [Candidatus Brockarchaeota archaeon]
MEVDGAQRSGSGTILRMSVAFASILNEELHIYNIRKKRPQPGLRPQHLEFVLVAAKLCNAEVRGAKIGSEELWFKPSDVAGGTLEAEIGTAGSIPMLLLGVLPICAFAKGQVQIRIGKGGTDVRNSPTVNYLRYVLAPTLSEMGLEVGIDVKSYGYYPVGMGDVTMRVQPARNLRNVRLTEFGSVKEIRGVSVCTFLKERKVAERQAEAAKQLLGKEGYGAEVEVVYDTSNPIQKGSSVVLWAKTTTGALLGGDSIGELRKSSEVVGKEAAQNLLDELRAGATVDVHLADMLVPYAALARGRSAYLARSMTEHLETNIWLAEELAGAKFALEKSGNLYRIEKL